MIQLCNTIAEKLSELCNHSNRAYIARAVDNIIKITYMADNDEYTMMYIVKYGDNYFLFSNDDSLPYIRYPIRYEGNMIEDIMYALRLTCESRKGN